MTNLASKNFGLEASLGNVDGYDTVNKWGSATDMDNGVPTDFWDGADGSTSTKVWAPPTQARTHQLTSTSANDTLAGTGVQKVKVYYLPDWDTAEASIVKDMDGTGNVALPSNVIIHRMKAIQWGSGGVAAGAITATADIDGTVTAAILAGKNQSQMAIYGVPSISRVRMTRFKVSVIKGAGANQKVQGELLVMIDPATNAADNTAWTNKQDFDSIEGTPDDEPFKPPKKFDGPCIIKIQGTADTNNSKGSARFDGYIVDN